MRCARTGPHVSTPRLLSGPRRSKSRMSEPLDWKTLYAAAMLESDRTLVRKRIERANDAIRARLDELEHAVSSEPEAAELEYALKYLRRLNIA